MLASVALCAAVITHLTTFSEMREKGHPKQEVVALVEQLPDGEIRRRVKSGVELMYMAEPEYAESVVFHTRMYCGNSRAGSGYSYPYDDSIEWDW